MLLRSPVSRAWFEREQITCKLRRHLLADRPLAKTSHISLCCRGFIEVSRVRRAKKADEKGSPFLSQEEESAAEVDSVGVDSASGVGYVAAEGGSNAADVV